MPNQPCMILYFTASDLPAEYSRTRCRELRAKGALLHLPSLAAPPDALTELPFGIILLHFVQCPDGLPSPANLRAAYPNAVILSLAETEPQSVWRMLPGTDGEIAAPDAEDFLAFLRVTAARYGLHPLDVDITSRGLWLPSKQREANLRGTPIALSFGEWTLLRVLCRMTPHPISAAMLAGFIRRPDSPPPHESIPVHICSINRKAGAIGVSRLIHFSRPHGYCLNTPYNLDS